MKTKTVVLTIIGVCVAVFLICGCIAVITSDSEPQSKAVAAVPTTEATFAPSKQAAGSPDPLSPVDKPEKVKMPDVRGQNAAVAGEYLKQLGFTKVKFGSQDDLDSWVVLPENWTVKKQSMKAGRMVSVDTLIVLTCTKID
jgi:hypothetical protein